MLKYLIILPLALYGFYGVYIGNYNANIADPYSVSNPLGLFGNPKNVLSVNNPQGKYGSKTSNESAQNPFATNAPKLFNQDGKYRGRLSANIQDSDSIRNKKGKYGNRNSSDSLYFPANKQERIFIFGQ